MGSTTLLSSECTLTKNRAFVSKSQSELSYDHDLGFFKVISNGEIWMSFRSHQVTGTDASSGGSVLKKHRVVLSVKFPNGDDYTLTFLAPSQTASMEAKAWIDNLSRVGQASMEVQRLLKVKERVQMPEIATILARYGVPSSIPDSRRMVEGLIASSAVDGVVEEEVFVSRLAKQRESVNYQVVTSFDVAKDGAISLKCPSCGSPSHTRHASAVRRCEYCGTEFTVPKRILDLL